MSRRMDLPLPGGKAGVGGSDRGLGLGKPAATEQ